MVWPVIRAAIDSAIEETEADFVRALNDFEAALDRKSFLSRFRERWSDGVEIVPFEPKFRQKFYDINAAWIEKHFVMEPPDRRALENPEEEIWSPAV